MKVLDEIIPIYDDYGNLYLKYNDKVYEFSINNKNDLELFEIFKNDNFNYDIVNNFDNIKQLNLLSKSNTLKSKIIREYIKEKEENPDIEYESDEEISHSDYDDIHYQMQFYPEELEIIHESELIEDDVTYKFQYFSNNFIPNKLIEINNDCENYNISCYDTFLYNNNELIFMSKPNILNSSYRIFLHSNGEVNLKIIGSIKKIYKISISDNNLILELN